MNASQHGQRPPLMGRRDGCRVCGQGHNAPAWWDRQGMTSGRVPHTSGGVAVSLAGWRLSSYVSYVPSAPCDSCSLPLGASPPLKPPRNLKHPAARALYHILQCVASIFEPPPPASHPHPPTSPMDT